MKTVLFLLSIGGVFCATAYDPYYPYGNNNQNVNTQITTLDGILARASPQAIRAYTQIVQNFSQSLADVKTALESWSRTYGLEEQYKKFVADSEKENADFKKAVADLMPKLTKFFNDYNKIGDDKKQSIMTAFNKTAALTNTFDDKQKAIIELILKTYLPSLNSGSNNQGIPVNGGYPGSNTGSPVYGGGIPINNGGYPGSNTGYPAAGNYPGYGNNAANNGGYPTNYGSYPLNNGAYQGNGGYPSNSGFPGNLAYPDYGSLQGNNGYQGNYPYGNTGSNYGFPSNQGGFQGPNGASQNGYNGFLNNNGNGVKQPSFGSNAMQGGQRAFF
ncbi:unnamed protein product [Cylicocyclus nassatus]|uniref:SXP/RAL-2 family protein Ani s 5-like cation-binding domain-containing protein n=1 Tax=Cylicocyclus nassatus TaxID=53992 RepID=A0AA36M959_CYLNA|nr:unnamed protein product [Cylicocyclus nassatus]